MKLSFNSYNAKDIIRIIREWTELTQEDFAKSIGVSLRVIQSYEQGYRKFTLDTLLKITKVHGIDITFEKK